MPIRKFPTILCTCAFFTMVAAAALAEEIPLILRSQVSSGGITQTQQKPEAWDAAKTAVIVCDMWDAHHCLNATKRVGELAPRIDQFISKLRDAGGTVIHAPSSCMEFYEGHPARQRAQAVPRPGALPEGIGAWLDWIDAEEEAAGYPIDHSDGGEDDDPGEHAAWAEELRSQGKDPRAPWTRQIDVIGIDAERDFITDDGVENWSILSARGIDRVMLVGVHTNMCVLGRPFGLRQLAKNGKRVVLVRDLTDTMYNPAMEPKVSHFEGTDLIIDHVERFVCPTISSEQILGGAPQQFAGDLRKHLVMMIGEKEYRTIETLPEFAKRQLAEQFRVSLVTPDPDDPNRFLGISALGSADVLLVSVRRRALPEEQLALLKKFVAAGKPVIGVRTASHAFSLRGKPAPAGHGIWEAWDPEVYGGHYSGHHGNQLKTYAKPVGEHPILSGLGRAEFATGGSLYQVRPLEEGATELLRGRAVGVEEAEPVAWTFVRGDGGRSFYTSLGHVDDFATPEFTALLRDGIYWAAGLEISKKN